MFWEKFGIYLHDEFQKYYYITTRRIQSEWIVEFFCMFTSKARLLAAKRGPEQHCNTDKSKQILGLKYRPGRQSLIEMMYWMIDVNYIPNKLPKQLAAKEKEYQKL